MRTEPLAGSPVRLTQQQCTGVRGDRSAVKRRHHLAPLDRCKFKQCRVHSVGTGELLWLAKALSQKNFRRFRAPVQLCEMRANAIDPTWIKLGQVMQFDGCCCWMAAAPPDPL